VAERDATIQGKRSRLEAQGSAIIDLLEKKVAIGQDKDSKRIEIDHLQKVLKEQTSTREALQAKVELLVADSERHARDNLRSRASSSPAVNGKGLWSGS
jgi:predicted RNase H-like nuclease (RuvC/YqgF family)